MSGVQDRMASFGEQPLHTKATASVMKGRISEFERLLAEGELGEAAWQLYRRILTFFAARKSSLKPVNDGHPDGSPTDRLRMIPTDAASSLELSVGEMNSSG